MFTNCRVLDIFDYICARNAQYWGRITKSDMEIQRYNRLKINIGTVSRWMTNKVQPTCEKIDLVDRQARTLRDCTPSRGLDVKELLVSSKKCFTD